MDHYKMTGMHQCPILYLCSKNTLLNYFQSVNHASHRIQLHAADDYLSLYTFGKLTNRVADQVADV